MSLAQLVICFVVGAAGGLVSWRLAYDRGYRAGRQHMSDVLRNAELAEDRDRRHRGA